MGRVRDDGDGDDVAAQAANAKTTMMMDEVEK